MPFGSGPPDFSIRLTVFDSDDVSRDERHNFQEYVDVYIDNTLITKQSGTVVDKGKTYTYKVIPKTVSIFDAEIQMESRRYKLREQEDGSFTYTGPVELRFGWDVILHLRADELASATVVNVEAPKPEQVNNTITIPVVEHVEYKDVDTGLVLSGTIEIDKDTTIEPVAINETDGYEYVISNPGNWLYTYKELVEAPKPSFKDNVITIPVFDGVEYVNNDTVVEGSWFLEEDTTITVRKAVVDESYILVNEGVDWLFPYEGGVRVYSVEPEFSNNVITIPQIEGVAYNIVSSQEVITEETLAISESLSLEAKALPGYRLMNPDEVYFFEYLRIVEAVKPSRTANTLYIPSIPGVEYFNDWNEETRVEVLTRPILLQKNGRPSITLSARAKEGFVISNPGQRWSFEYAKNKVDLVINRPTSAFDKDKIRHIVKIDGEIIPNEDTNILIPTKQTNFEITIVDDSTFSERPYLNIKGTRNTFKLSEDGRVATLDIRFLEEDRITLEAGALNRELRDLDFIGKNTTLYIKKGVNETLHVLRGGQSVRLPTWTNYRFEIIADEGFSFEYYGKFVHGEEITDIGLKTGDQSGTVAQLLVNRFLHDATIFMDASFIEEETPSDVLGFNHMYLVDKDKLMEISLDIFKKRWAYIDTQPGTPLPERFDPFIATDPHTYIINTLQLPFEIPEDLLGTEQGIMLGFTQLTPRAPTITRDKISIDLGSIYTPSKYENSYDYKGTDILLHLPYMNPVSIDANYAIDETIFIRYIVDLYTGETTVNLASTLTKNKVFYSSTTLIGNVVPFVAVKDAAVIGDPKSSRTVIHNNTPTPFIEVVRNKAHQIDSKFNRDIKTTVDSLIDTKGHIFIHDIDLDLDTTLDELTTLKSILAGGVIIK